MAIKIIDTYISLLHRYFAGWTNMRITVYFYGYLTALSIAQSRTENRMISEYWIVPVGKEPVVALYEALYSHLSQGSEENYITLPV
jgi:hypothetical protein